MFRRRLGLQRLPGAAGSYAFQGGRSSPGAASKVLKWRPKVDARSRNGPDDTGPLGSSGPLRHRAVGPAFELWWVELEFQASKLLPVARLGH
ncbi:hypothetical protein NL676_033394 [Syzygium grande]|nr:hypothetical protein NL676_033394 [Syzygium grande]